MKLLVTGRDGQLARSLAERAAVWPDIELATIGRPDLDLEVPGSAAASIERLAPDLVINAAAYTDVDGAEEQPLRAQRINGEAAGEAAAAAAAIGAPIIHISTDYVFDGSDARPYAEDAPTRPINAYGRTKLMGEEAVRAANPAHLIVRTAWVYSPFGRNFVKTMFEAATEREELRVISDKRGSPTSALDLADALLKVANGWRQGARTGQGETYHLAGSGEASWYDLAEEVMRCRRRLGLRVARLVPIPASDWPMRAVRPSFSVLSNEKFARDFGFGLPPWTASVTGVVERLVGTVA
jgi:dTDP-4-dehydrorhamnose reductase